MHAPTPHQARGRSSTSASQKKKSAPAQAAVSGASGVISTPVVNQNGSAATSAIAAVAAVRSNQRAVSAAQKPAVTSAQAMAPIRTAHSL